MSDMQFYQNSIYPTSKLNVRVTLKPILRGVGIITTIKAGIKFPDGISVVVGTQQGIIYKITEGVQSVLLDISNIVLFSPVEIAPGILYEGRGLFGIEFHPNFHKNGRLFLFYSAAGTQGTPPFDPTTVPDPCNPQSLNAQWIDRNLYDHINTIQEWKYDKSCLTYVRTLLNIKHPFVNNNGNDNLVWSPEFNTLLVTYGDGGSKFDILNLAQNDDQPHGKILSINVDSPLWNQCVLQNGIPTLQNNITPISRLSELQSPYNCLISVVAKGVHTGGSVVFESNNGEYIKYYNQQGQDYFESAFAWREWITKNNYTSDKINYGWRAWEGEYPTLIRKTCENGSRQDVTLYFNDSLNLSTRRYEPFLTYSAFDVRPGKLAGDFILHAIPYHGDDIPELKGKVIFADASVRTLQGNNSIQTGVGFLGSVNIKRHDLQNLQEYYPIEITNILTAPSIFTAFNSNKSYTRLYLGVYNSFSFDNPTAGVLYEIVGADIQTSQNSIINALSIQGYCNGWYGPELNESQPKKKKKTPKHKK